MDEEGEGADIQGAQIQHRHHLRNMQHDTSCDNHLSKTNTNALLVLERVLRIYFALFVGFFIRFPIAYNVYRTPAAC